MFSGCTGLTTAPELPAATLAIYCYQEMFKGCTSLNKVTCLATDISAGGSITSWLSDVASTGTIIMAENMDAWENGADGIPEGWIRKELTEYPLWVGGKQVTSANASDVLGNGKVSFTPADGDTPATLTLNGATISGGTYPQLHLHRKRRGHHRHLHSGRLHVDGQQSNTNRCCSDPDHLRPDRGWHQCQRHTDRT